jgi:hypothetical protein
MSNIHSGLGSKSIKTFALLDQIVTVLGGTTQSFWPFLNGTGADTYTYGSGSDGGPLVANASTLELVFDPSQHVGGVHSYANNSASANLAAADDADYSFGDASVDAPFSIGCWILMQEALGTARSILAKFGTTAATAEEYDFRFTTAGKLEFELHDPSVPATEIATSTGTAITPFIWQFVTMTYDGGETAPVINLYLNATSVHDGTSVEAGAYVAMENTTAVLMLGSRDAAGTAAQVFQGRMALPFVTGKALTAAEVTTLYGIGRELLGV